ncbi:MAG: alpha/beta hydrolase [Anaerolineales bacterium]|nr:alpha/beta hydrolase [Anaerolineales bacterium]
MPEWTDGDVDVDGVRIHYTRTGGEKPPFVLVHGFSDDGLCWTPVAEVLQADYDVVMMDAGGHGRSAAPESGGYDSRSQAHDVQTVIETLQLSNPLILGHSMGAVTTMILAAVYPNTPRAILLEDPPPWWVAPTEDADEVAARNAAGFTAWLTDLQSKSREQLIEEAGAENPNWPQAELGPWADSKLRFRLKAVAAVAGRRPHQEVDWEALLKQITCPVLLITADQELGAILSPAAVEMIREWVPQTQISHIAQAGHSIRRDQFGPYLQAVKGFVSSIAS